MNYLIFILGIYFGIGFVLLIDKITDTQMKKHFSLDENKAKGSNKNIQVKIERLK